MMDKYESTEVFKKKVVELKNEKEKIEKLALEKEELEKNEIIKTIKRYMEVSKTIDDYKDNKNFSNTEEIINYLYFENQSSVKTPSLYIYIGDWGGGYLAHDYAPIVHDHYMGTNNYDANFSYYAPIGTYEIPYTPGWGSGLDYVNLRIPGDKEKFESTHNVIYLEADSFNGMQKKFLNLRAEFFEYLVEEDEEKAITKMMEKYGKSIDSKKRLIYNKRI